MSAAINSKRLWGGVPDRPLSADPTSATTTSSSIRPSFSSFSSFSSSISSVFGGRHSRTNSTSTLNALSATARPASTAPQQEAKWVPRPVTPGTANQSRSSRHRATSSASAAAAALSSSAEAPPPPLLVPPDSHRRSSPDPPGEGADSAALEAWKVKIQKAMFTKYQNRARAWEHAFATGAVDVNKLPPRRRDSLSSGSSASSGDSAGEGRLSDEMRLRLAREETLLKLKREYEEEVRTAIRDEARRRGVTPYPLPPIPPLPVRVASRSQREQGNDILVEDEMADEWTWRPEEHGRRPSDDTRKDKWKEMVRQEQQVIWDTIKRGTNSTPQQQQEGLSSFTGRKVHFAPATPPSSDHSNPNSTPPSATPLSASQTQPPSLPRTPHTAVASGYPARSISAHPSVSTMTSGLSANRPMSPAVSAPGVRPGSARPASPAYTRWIPSSGATPSTATNNSGQGHGTGARTGSTPIAIPRRSSGTRVDATEGNGSAGRERTGSMSGSWRDWSSSAHGHGNANGHLSGMRRDAPTPSPTAANGSSPSHGYPQAYPRTSSNSNLHSSASIYATVQMHGRTPSSGNLHASHGRVPSNGNLQSGANMRRAFTPGPVSSASGYARQRTVSATQRPPSVPPVFHSQPRDKDKDREYAYGREYISLRDRERAKKGVVDDRELDDTPTNTNPVKRVQATAGLGSRTSSNRSALVDEDAPPPEAFSSSPAPVMRSSSSRQSRSHLRHGDADGDEEEVQIPKRDKGKGKARAPPSPLLSTTPLPRTGRDVAGLYAAQFEDFASSLRRDLGISTEA